MNMELAGIEDIFSDILGKIMVSSEYISIIQSRWNN